MQDRGRFPYLVDLHENEQIVAVQIDLMTRSYCRCNRFDNVVPLEVFVIPDRWSNRELWFHCMLASRLDQGLSSDNRWQRYRSYLLPCILFPVKMRCKDLFCDRLKTFLIGFLNACDRGEAFHKTTILVLNAVYGILADLVDKRYRLNWCSCLEKDHCLRQSYVCWKVNLSSLLTALSI